MTGIAPLKAHLVKTTYNERYYGTRFVTKLLLLTTSRPKLTTSRPKLTTSRPKLTTSHPKLQRHVLSYVTF